MPHRILFTENAADEEHTFQLANGIVCYLGTRGMVAQKLGPISRSNLLEHSKFNIKFQVIFRQHNFTISGEYDGSKYPTVVHLNEDDEFSKANRFIGKTFLRRIRNVAKEIKLIVLAQSQDYVLAHRPMKSLTNGSSQFRLEKYY